jgi:hypothetical protein
MSLIRGHHSFDDEFTQIPNAWIRDNRLTLAARGLLTQLLSHSPGWKITEENLAKANGVGRMAISTMLKQLVEFGYLSKSRERERNEHGQLAGFIYQTQDPTETNPVTVYQKPTSAEPTLGEPTLAGHTHKKNIIKEQQVKEEQVKETNARIEREFETFYNLYPRKVARGRAKLAYVKALKRTDPETLIAGLQTWIDKTQIIDKRFIPHPESWLNADRWLDEDFVTTPTKQKLVDKDAERAAQLARMIERERLEDEQNATQ